MGSKNDTKTAARSAEPTLAQLRFRKLVRAMHSHGTGESVVAIGKRFDASPELLTKIIAGEDGVHADEATIERAAQEMELHPDYFHVEELGEFTTHEHFVGGSPLGKSASTEG